MCATWVGLTSNTHSQTAAGCRAGFGVSGSSGACSVCPIGSWSTGGVLKGPCSACPTGLTTLSTGSTSSSSCSGETSRASIHGQLRGVVEMKTSATYSTRLQTALPKCKMQYSNSVQCVWQDLAAKTAPFVKWAASVLVAMQTHFARIARHAQSATPRRQGGPRPAATAAVSAE